MPGLQAADAVTGGTVEAAFTTSYYYIGKDPTFIFATCLPFGMNPRQQTAWMLHGGGSELLADFYRSQNIVCLPAGNTACQMGGWFRREIRSLADLRGLKMRVGGLAGQVLARVGVVPQQLAGGDIYPALERGVIDAAEWIGPHDDEKLGFNRVAPFYYYPGWWEGGTQEHLFVNAAAWDGLPPSYQAALRTAGWYANTWLLAKFDTVNPPAMRRLLAQGAQLRPFPAEMTQACWREAHALYAEIAAANPTFRRVLEHYLAFRDEQYQWLQVAEYSYDTFMIRQLRART